MNNIACLTAREAIAQGISLEVWLHYTTRSEQRALQEAEDALRDAQDQGYQEWKRAERAGDE